MPLLKTDMILHSQQQYFACARGISPPPSIPRNECTMDSPPPPPPHPGTCTQNHLEASSPFPLLTSGIKGITFQQHQLSLKELNPSQQSMGSNPLQNFYGFCYSPRTLSSNSSIVQTKWHLRTWEGSALKSVTDLRVPAKRQPSPIQLLAFSTTQSSVCVQAPVQTVFPLDSTGEQCTLLYANHHTERCSSPC